MWNDRLCSINMNGEERIIRCASMPQEYSENPDKLKEDIFTNVKEDFSIETISNSEFNVIFDTEEKAQLVYKKVSKKLPKIYVEQHLSLIRAESPEIPEEEGKFKILVQNIPASMRNKEFSEFFSQFGKVVHSHVFLKHENKKDSKSQEYGVITYALKSDQEKVLEMIDLHIHDNKLILSRINESQRYFSESKMLYFDFSKPINNQKAFIDFISKIAIPTSIDFRVTHAFIYFNNSIDALNVLNKYNYEQYESSIMRIIWGDHYTFDIRRSHKNLYCLHNLHQSIDASQLYRRLSFFGEIIFCKISKSKKHGFVQYRNNEDAQNMIRKMNYMTIFNNLIVISDCSNTKSTFNDFVRISVLGLPENYTEKEIRKLFSRCGNIQAVNKIELKPEYNTVNAEVIFDSIDAAQKAFYNFNFHVINETPILIRFLDKDTQALIKTSIGKLKITGIPSSIPLKEVFDLLVDYGDVATMRQPKNDGLIVQYRNDTFAQEAITGLNGKEYFGAIIEVEKSQ